MTSIYERRRKAGYREWPATSTEEPAVCAIQHDLRVYPVGTGHDDGRDSRPRNEAASQRRSLPPVALQDDFFQIL